jgi:hypothetical protein
MEKSSALLEVRHDWYSRGFWTTIIILLGFLAGVFFAQEVIIKPKLNEAIKLGGIVIDNSVYELKIRP